MGTTLLLNCLKFLATLASGIGKKRKLFILIYHRVLDEPDYMRPGEIDKEKFSWQMELLAKYFNVLPLSEAIEKLKANNLPARAVCITFDDGYADNYHNALPILKQNGLTATFFIASGFLNGGRMWNDTIIEVIRNVKQDTLNLNKIGLGVFNTSTNKEKQAAVEKIISKIKYLPPEKRAENVEYIATLSDKLPDNLMLTSKELKGMSSEGMDIGGHTVNHPILASLSSEKTKQEISENKQFLEGLLGKMITVFAFPNGKPGEDYLPEQIEVIKQEGYKTALSTQWGVANQNSDQFQLPRFTPWDGTPVQFMVRMVRMFVKVL